MTNAIMAGIIVIAALLGVTAWALHSRADARLQWAQAALAAKGNADEVEAMAKRLRECVGQADETAARLAEMEEARQREAEARTAMLRREREAIEALYRDDADCDAWSRAQICEAVRAQVGAP